MTRCERPLGWGIDAAVADHHHSPGFEVMPNGDALMIPYSGPSGREGGRTSASCRPGCAMVPRSSTCRKNVSVQGVRMQDLLTADGKPALAGPRSCGGRGPRSGCSRAGHIGRACPNHGNSTARRLPRLQVHGQWRHLADRRARAAILRPTARMHSRSSTPFARRTGICLWRRRQGWGRTSMLWRSSDNGGLSWTDQGGRTSGRHSTIVPLNTTARCLSLGGKDTQINGYMPQNISTNWGVTWGARPRAPSPGWGETSGQA
jgi:hypothetical protein